MPLTDVAVPAAKPKESRYRLSDGNSLYLKIHPTGRKTWEFRFKRDGTIKAYVIGAYPDIGLGAARLERDRLRREMRATGADPLAARKKTAAETERAREEAKAAAERIRAERARQKEVERAAKLKAAKEAARQRLTVEALLVLWERHKLPVWSDRSRGQIMQHANDYVLPVIGDKVVSELRLADALAVVDPLIAEGKLETARRVRQRMSEMLDYAAAHHNVSNNVVRLATADLKDRFKRAHRDHPEKSHPTLPMAELRSGRSCAGTRR